MKTILFVSFLLFASNAFAQAEAMISTPEVYFTKEFYDYMNCSRDLIKAQAERNSVALVANTLIYRENLNLPTVDPIPVFREYPDLMTRQALYDNLFACQLSVFQAEEDLQTQWNRLYQIFVAVEKFIKKPRTFKK